MTIGFDTFSRRTLLVGSIVTETGLHIGTSSSTPVAGVDKVVLTDNRGYPFIPGSSLKGIIRAAAASVLRGFGRSPSTAAAPCLAWSCKDDLEEQAEQSLLGNGRCFDAKMLSIEHADGRALTDAQRQLVESRAEQLRNELGITIPISAEGIATGAGACLCPTCVTFGSPYFAAKARFSDCFLDDHDHWLGIERRDGVGIDRATRTAAHGIKYDFEVVPPGTSFEFEVLLENADETEEAMVLLGFDMLNRGFARLGGIKSRGLGRVRIHWRSVEEWDAPGVLTQTPVTQIALTPGDETAAANWNTWIETRRRALETATKRQQPENDNVQHGA